VRRVALTLALAGVLAAPLAAQSGGQRMPRKWLYAVVGAAASATLGLVYASNFEEDIGGCSSVGCVMTVSTLGGALIGFMIGSELDHLYNVRYSHAPPLGLRGRALSLAVDPTDLAVREHTAFVTGQDGIELVNTDQAFARQGFKARGLRGIGPIDSDSARNALFVGTAAGLYRFPLRGDEPGALALQADISALARNGGVLALGLGTDLQLALPDDSLRTLDSALATDSRVMDLAWRGDTVLWALTEEALLAYAADSSGVLTRVGSVSLPGIARRLAIVDSLAFLAAGSGGLYLVDIRNPAGPVIAANWSGARFVYDVAVSGSLVYAAAGPEGLYVLQYGGGAFKPIGLSRGLGFVASVEAADGAIFALDRSGATLRRIDPVDHK
jgi:hypothetical protein